MCLLEYPFSKNDIQNLKIVDLVAETHAKLRHSHVEFPSFNAVDLPYISERLDCRDL